MKQRKEKTMRKIISFMLVLIVMAVPFTFTATALACDDIELNREPAISVQVLGESEVNRIKSYVTVQYHNSTNMADKMGYLFALKAIGYCGKSYDEYDCSQLVAQAILDAYSTYGYSSYSPFIGQRTSGNQYNYCYSRGFTTEINATGNDPSIFNQLKTGDLVFWRGTNSQINHVGIFINYNGSHHFVESMGGYGVVVSDVWQNSTHIYTAYARLCRTNRVVFQTGAPFNELISGKMVFYNFPPSPPTPPTYSGYAFVSWSPSITTGVTANTTYTANYVLRANRSQDTK